MLNEDGGATTMKAANRNFALSKELEEKERQFRERCRKLIAPLERQLADRKELQGLKRKVLELQSSPDFSRWDASEKESVAYLLRRIEEGMPSWLYLQADIAFDKGLKAKAVRTCKELIAAYPDSSEAESARWDIENR